MKKLMYALMVLFSVGLMSCGGGGGNKADNQKPTITLNSPTSSTDVVAGNNLNVSAALSDNADLSSYVITIAYSGPKSVKNVEEYSFNSNSDKDAEGNSLPSISGKNASLNFNIGVKDNAQEGTYKFTIKVSDKAGNEATEEASFTISRP